MANITNPQAVLYCNAVIRPLADRMMQLLRAAQLAESEFTAQGLNALIPNDASPIIDGSATDGRTPITGGDVNILLANAQTYINTFTANSNLIQNQTLKVAVNPGS